MKKSPEKEISITAVVLVVAVLVVLNIWLFEKAFSSPSPDLPRLNLSLTEAASFLKEEKNITWNKKQNILILGKSGDSYIAPDLTDTIMVLSVDPVVNPPEAKIVSVPRDLLVKESGFLMRTNSLWLYLQSSDNPVDSIKNRVSGIVGLPIDSVLVFDLKTAEKIVDAVDGITVYVQDNIYDPRFPTKDGGYETFRIQKGWRYLSSQDALRFVRTRALSGGDFGRIENQQEFLRALKGKVVSLNPVWDFGKLLSIFNIAQKEIVTDLSVDDIKNLWAVGKFISFEEVETMSVNIESGLVRAEKVMLGGQEADVLVASGKDQFDYSEIQKTIKDFTK